MPTTGTNEVFERTGQSQQIDNKIPANDKIKERDETNEASENEFRANNVYALYQININTLFQERTFHPLSYPVVMEHDSRYKHNPSHHSGFKRPESLHSAADTDSVQRPISFWKHENYKPSPMAMNSLRSNNSFGIATFRNNLTFSMIMEEAKYLYRARERSTLIIAIKIFNLDINILVHINTVQTLQDAEWKPVIVRIEILLMIPVPHTLMSHRCQKNKCQALVTQ